VQLTPVRPLCAARRRWVVLPVDSAELSAMVRQHLADVPKSNEIDGE
jgi:hypothetical protein